MTELKKSNQNARKHGVFAAEIIPPGDTNKQRLKRTRRKLAAQLRPCGPLQRAIVRDLALRLLHKRKFDRWYDKEFRKAFTRVSTDELQTNLRTLEELNGSIFELEELLNNTTFAAAMTAYESEKKDYKEGFNHLAEMEKIRKTALLPLLESRERIRREIEQSSTIRTLERLRRCDAAVTSGLERGMKQLAMAKTFDELYGPKLIERLPPAVPHHIEYRAKAIQAPGSVNQSDTKSGQSDSRMRIFSSSDLEPEK